MNTKPKGRLPVFVQTEAAPPVRAAEEGELRDIDPQDIGGSTSDDV